MIDDIWDVQTPAQLQKNIALRAKQRRKDMHLTREALSRKSGVSLGSLKRFEDKGEISLASLIKIAYALNMHEEFNKLFYTRVYDFV